MEIEVLILSAFTVTRHELAHDDDEQIFGYFILCAVSPHGNVFPNSKGTCIENTCLQNASPLMCWLCMDKQELAPRDLWERQHN